MGKGKKKAGKRSKIVDSGRDSLNIDIQNGNSVKQRKLKIYERALLVMLILYLASLHILMFKFRQQAATLDSIQDSQKRLECIVQKIQQTMKISFDITGQPLSD